MRLARTRLRDAPRRAADEEDAVLSAFTSLCRRAQEGRFPRLSDRDELWQLLVLLTARKASNLVRQERRQRRGGGRGWNASALDAGDAGEGPAFANLIGREPDPEFAAQVAEECRRLLGRLGDTTLQAVAVWKMEGYTNEEIAQQRGCVARTVKRRLRMIRDRWQEKTEP